MAAEKQRAHAMAATGRQRAPSNSERGLHPLLAPGLGREGHMRERCSCAHLLLSHARQTMMFIVLLARLLSWAVPCEFQTAHYRYFEDGESVAAA